MLILFRYTTYCIGTRTLSDTWMGYLFVHLSGYNCIQKLHMGLAKHVHLSGLCTYSVCTYAGSGHVQNVGQKFGVWRMCVLIRVVHLSGVHLSGFYCMNKYNATKPSEHCRYNLMHSCWKKNPLERPPFEECKSMVGEMLLCQSPEVCDFNGISLS